MGLLPQIHAVNRRRELAQVEALIGKPLLSIVENEVESEFLKRFYGIGQECYNWSGWLEESEGLGKGTPGTVRQKIVFQLLLQCGNAVLANHFCPRCQMEQPFFNFESENRGIIAKCEKDPTRWHVTTTTDGEYESEVANG